MQFWKKLTAEERKSRIKEVLDINVDFSKDASLGYPASKLDGKVFYDDAPFLKDALVLQTYVANPNQYWLSHFWYIQKKHLVAHKKLNEKC
jgi:tyrosine decarboxylase/aspartate 1-decarboxylase